MHIIVISVWISLYVYVSCTFDFTIYIYMICYFHDLHCFLLKIHMS